jgi:hypothetical protein
VVGRGGDHHERKRVVEWFEPPTDDSAIERRDRVAHRAFVDLAGGPRRGEYGPSVVRKLVVVRVAHVDEHDAMLIEERGQTSSLAAIRQIGRISVHKDEAGLPGPPRRLQFLLNPPELRLAQAEVRPAAARPVDVEKKTAMAADADGLRERVRRQNFVERTEAALFHIMVAGDRVDGDAQHLKRRGRQPVLRWKAIVGVVARQHDEIERSAKFDFELRDD